MNSSLHPRFPLFGLLLCLTLTLWSGITLGQSVPSYVPTSGLVGWWGFNGNAQDGSGNGNHGTVNNGLSYTEDRLSSNSAAIQVIMDWSLCSSPTGFGVTFPVNLINENYTVSVWVRSYDSTAHNQTIFNSSPHNLIGVGFNFGVNNPRNTISSFFGNGYWLLTNNNITWNTTALQDWKHFVVVKFSNELKYYENGSLVFSHIIMPYGQPLTLDSIRFGSTTVNSGCYEPFYGKLDDIGIWNRALTPQEITNLYNSQSCQVSITTQPSSQTTGTNRNVQFSVVSSDSNSTYRWQTDMGLGFQNLTNAGQYSGVNTSTLNVSNTSPHNDNQLFRCIVSTTNCGSDTSDAVTLNVNTSPTSTGVPKKFTYQSVVRDTSGQLVTNRPVSMRLSLQRGPQMSNLYTETHQLTTNSNGLLTCIIGSGQPTLGMMDTIDWSGGMVYVKTEIDMTGGSNYSLVSTRELLSVPYALYSLNSGSSTPGPVGPMGPQGVPGPQGPSGVSFPAGGTSGQALFNCNGVPTWGPCPNQPTMPTVITNPVTLLPGNSASTGGNVTSDGGSPVTHRGVVYDTTSNPSLTSNYTVDGSGTGSFVSTLNNLAPTTTYYTRAYATNSVGTAYGSVVSFSTTLSLPTVSIGQNYAGGIVFYIDQTGQHGLVCAPFDQGTAPWGLVGVDVQGTSTNVGTGALNTSFMVGYGISAATLCDTLVLNGYSDWFLPSAFEMQLMYYNLHQFNLGNFPTNTSDVNQTMYWSSSQYNLFNAWNMRFADNNLNGDDSGDGKWNIYRVRAARAF